MLNAPIAQNQKPPPPLQRPIDLGEFPVLHGGPEDGVVRRLEAETDRHFASLDTVLWDAQDVAEIGPRLLNARASKKLNARRWLPSVIRADHVEGRSVQVRDARPLEPQLRQRRVRTLHRANDA
jgi:hypothetical protein